MKRGSIEVGPLVGIRAHGPCQQRLITSYVSGLRRSTATPRSTTVLTDGT